MSVNWRYWRLHVVTVTSATYVAVEFMKISATAGGATILTGGTPTASSEFSGSFNAAKAFIDDTQYWSTTASPTLPQWIQYDIGSAATGRYLEIRAFSATDYAPLQIILKGSSDGSTWVDLLSINVTSYAVTGRWYVATKTVRIPFGHIVSGNSTHSDTTEIQRVLINNWTTGAFIDSVVPDSAGDWESVVTGTADVLVTHIGDSGYRPLADGPITPATR